MLLSPQENDDAHTFAMSHYARGCRSKWLRRKAKQSEVRVRAKNTGVGYGIVVECPNCGEACDITDYTCW